MITSAEYDSEKAKDILNAVAQYKQSKQSEMNGKTVFKWYDVENFTTFLEEVEGVFTQFYEAAPSVVTPVEIVDEEKEPTLVLTAEDVGRMEWEIKLIEEHYPGEENLHAKEKLCKRLFSSLHEFQYFIARHRSGDVTIVHSDDGLFITGNE